MVLLDSGSQTGGHGQGARGLLPGSLERILKQIIVQGLILKFGFFKCFEFLTH